MLPDSQVKPHLPLLLTVIINQVLCHSPLRFLLIKYSILAQHSLKRWVILCKKTQILSSSHRRQHQTSYLITREILTALNLAIELKNWLKILYSMMWSLMISCWKSCFINTLWKRSNLIGYLLMGKLSIH